MKNRLVVRLFGPALLGAAVVLGSACANVREEGVRYAATIERIEEVGGDHYTPGKGRTPLTRIHCHSPSQGAFLILIAGIYAESIYGDIGDSIAFVGPGSIPASAAFYIEQLRGYKVVARKKG